MSLARKETIIGWTKFDSKQFESRPHRNSFPVRDVPEEVPCYCGEQKGISLSETFTKRPCLIHIKTAEIGYLIFAKQIREDSFVLISFSLSPKFRQTLGEDPQCFSADTLVKPRVFPLTVSAAWNSLKKTTLFSWIIHKSFMGFF